MQVLVATDQWFPDVMGGVARVATETARRWSALGHEVTVIAPQGVRRGEERDGGLTVHRVLPRRRLPQTVTDPLATGRFARRLGSKGWDVLVAHTCTTAYGLLAAGLHAPLMYVFHADPVLESRFVREGRLPLSTRLATVVVEQPLQYFARSSLRRATSVAVLSEYSHGLVWERSDELANKVVQLSGGVDSARFARVGHDESRSRLGIPAETRLVFTVRRLVPRMGLDQLLAAVDALSDVDDLQLAIAGTGSLASELRAQRDRLGLDGRVRFLGRVSDEELARWYSAADLFVLPTVAHEGFGLVTAEALSAGTPVVGTPVGATPELLTPLEPRLVSRGADASALADALRTGLRLATAELRSRAAEYARTRLSWDAVMPAWDAALRDTARSR